MRQNGFNLGVTFKAAICKIFNLDSTNQLYIKMQRTNGVLSTGCSHTLCLLNWTFNLFVFLAGQASHSQLVLENSSPENVSLYPAFKTWSFGCNHWQSLNLQTSVDISTSPWHQKKCVLLPKKAAHNERQGTRANIIIVIKCWRTSVWLTQPWLTGWWDPRHEGWLSCHYGEVVALKIIHSKVGCNFGRINIGLLPNYDILFFSLFKPVVQILAFSNF